ncbi:MULTISPECIES: cytochrome c [unclassified Lentimonas]|uniref:c-type cytochrome n=1 Tax=unclassified Lentimonas TaxID=2630993 RepID=UPI00132A5A96|nr:MULTISPECIES: cytochrome c [unclassified Lentimonas]CAA6679035.1 Cytochrome c oxidase polypeptide II (EC [Lentimonas sp. CC4]CAA6684225.1 Cytochrome c oxidase polypeptide II (EC [Lentimonas sp. CC6]CAA7076402.1 Cytochrome c oxidase polypeptide II (EC [Lentimonas sp. CC4]CAA7171827.1 Cytochrome c oxidase polypeptide II (EC [Lentimonas sp. CC21]CAA7183157.1 Cytochrome c oxidase polypeptide II (EC [Lentimonas sp. CC8]
MSDEQHNNDTGEQELHDSLMREQEEPRDGSSPIPIFILFLFAALCFWGGVYLIEFGGHFNKDAYTLDFDPNAEVVVVQVSLYDRGAKVFKAQCVACHQDSGLGVPGVYPPLAGSEWVTGHQESLARILINGLNGPIEVAGNTYNGNMPAFGPSGLNLKPLEIAGVLTYIRQEWGNEASEVTEATMNGYMDQYGSRSTPWTAEEVVIDLGEEPVSEAPAAEEAPAEAGEEAPAEVAAH